MPLFDASRARVQVVGGQAGQRGPDPQAPGAAAVQARQPPVRRVADPTNTRALDDIKFHTNLTVEPILVDEERLAARSTRADERRRARRCDVDDSEGLENLEVIGGDDDAGDTGVDAKGDPVVKFINKVLLDAIKRGASDIHFEPYETEYRVRLRIDGILQARSPRCRSSCKDAIAARLKVMAQLDIAEKRVPQDGRIKLNVSKTKQIDFRVSTLPDAVRREDRAAYPRQGRLQARHRQARLRGRVQKPVPGSDLQKPYGMVLVTGPTGSGKTVSLYTA
jgi:type IV pilus assembly protein PilB